MYVDAEREPALCISSKSQHIGRGECQASASVYTLWRRSGMKGNMYRCRLSVYCEGKNSKRRCASSALLAAACERDSAAEACGVHYRRVALVEVGGIISPNHSSVQRSRLRVGHASSKHNQHRVAKSNHQFNTNPRVIGIICSENVEMRRVLPGGRFSAEAEEIWVNSASIKAIRLIACCNAP